MYSGEEFLKNFVPNDSSRQHNAEILAERIVKSNKIKDVLDLGCGLGNSSDLFLCFSKEIIWTGLDIENSDEVSKRKRTDVNFISYDGINIPFSDSSFDMIYSQQVFEHVEYPFELIKEINRTLRKGGFFVGSTSQLEPFHGLSTFNYTPYGFGILLKGTSLKFIELRPGIDVVTLIMSRFLGNLPVFSWYFRRCFAKQSPINLFLTIIGKLMGKNNQDINLLKLLLNGQFCFVIQKV